MNVHRVADRDVHERGLELAALAIDFDLTGNETAELEAHLATCPTCPQRAAAMRADNLDLGRPLTLLPSSRVDTAVYAEIARRHARPQRLVLLAAAALLLLVALLGAVAGAAYLLRTWQTLPTIIVPAPTAPVAVVSPRPDGSPLVVPTTATGWSRVPTHPSVSGAQFQRVVWTGTRFVATASALDGNGGVFLDSTDGLIWNRQATESADQFPVVLAAGPKGVVAVGATDDQVTAWSSPDGLTWRVRPDAFPAPTGESGHAGPTTFTVRGLVATDDGWLAVGREDPVCQVNCGTDPVRPLVWRSSDGLAWTSIPVAGLGGGGMGAIVRTTDGYVAVGLGKSRAAVWISSDGTTWTAVADQPLFHARPGIGPSTWVEMNGVAADRGVVVAVGMDGPQSGGEGRSVRAWWSLDGRTWSEATGERFLSGQAFGVTSTPDGFLATGPSGSESCLGGIWESADGREWTCVAIDPAFAGFGPYAAAASSSEVVAVGLEQESGPESGQGSPGAVWRKQLP